jgi:multisubunit Na+/H+ antiporter MnhG subunit
MNWTNILAALVGALITFLVMIGAVGINAFYEVLIEPHLKKKAKN